jgi:hypothetical protein
MFYTHSSRRVFQSAVTCSSHVLPILVSLAGYLICPSAALAQQNPVPSIQSSSPTQAVAGATVALTLTGAGFVPGTVILANGVAVSTTYQSSTSVVAPVPAPAGSTADVVVQARNPAPGGGTSPAVKLGVAMLELNASDVDGTNTGTARLSGGVNLATINTDAAHHTVSWSLQGAGTLTPTGNNNFGATY